MTDLGKLFDEIEAEAERVSVSPEAHAEAQREAAKRAARRTDFDPFDVDMTPPGDDEEDEE